VVVVSSSGGEGAKAFGGIALLIAGLAGMAAIMRPMNQQLDMMKENITAINGRMEHDDLRERLDAGQLSHLMAMTKAAAEAEKEEKIAIRDLQLWSADHDMRVRALNAAQWERIKSLERQLYGKAVANDPQ